MYFFIECGDRLDVGVPAMLLSQLLDSLPNRAERSPTSIGERVVLAVMLVSGSRNDALVLDGARTQEWDTILSSRQGALDVFSVLVLVADVSVQDEGRCVQRGREGALSRLQRGTVRRAILHAESLNALPGDRVERSILPEEFAVAHGRVIERLLVIKGRIEVLASCRVGLPVVLRALDVEVAKPPEFAIDIAIFDNGGPLWHASALDLIQLARIQFTLGLEQNWLCLLEILVEELLKVHVVVVIELGRAVVVPFVPLEI